MNSRNSRLEGAEVHQKLIFNWFIDMIGLASFVKANSNQYLISRSIKTRLKARIVLLQQVQAVGRCSLSEVVSRGSVHFARVMTWSLAREPSPATQLHSGTSDRQPALVATTQFGPLAGF